MTGGTQGIGLSISQAFARLGAQVVIADLQAERAEPSRERPSRTGYFIP
ncbi:SDR family NAD(P)-dependent oxidoreductase [Prodigiosinella aquatilis]|nr:SDR family NAD(P)-dependent oxidoreductase [Prodigiosinella sp. LS101]WJV54655.1 SDR family NAD(P)-dependent oxidoreductase [Prodigiosinella sp. LS101]WJV59018.1 SDR family NAD(P)-dependent oxidoreductase [Pectobacteriaceae bacterium C111]